MSKQICLLLKANGVDVYKVGTLRSLSDSLGVPRCKTVSDLTLEVFKKFVRDDATFDCYQVPISRIPDSAKISDSQKNVVVC